MLILRLAERLLLEYLNGDIYSIQLFCLSMVFRKLNSAAVTVARSPGVSPNVKLPHIISPIVNLPMFSLPTHCHFAESQIAECEFGKQQYQFPLFLATPFGDVTFSELTFGKMTMSKRTDNLRNDIQLFDILRNAVGRNDIRHSRRIATTPRSVAAGRSVTLARYAALLGTHYRAAYRGYP